MGFKNFIRSWNSTLNRSPILFIPGNKNNMNSRVQFFSSLLSLQSLSRSHLYRSGMQRPFAHSNSVSVQFSKTKEEFYVHFKVQTGLLFKVLSSRRVYFSGHYLQLTSIWGKWKILSIE